MTFYADPSRSACYGEFLSPVRNPLCSFSAQFGRSAVKNARRLTSYTCTLTCCIELHESSAIYSAWRTRRSGALRSVPHSLENTVTSSQQTFGSAVLHDTTSVEDQNTVVVDDGPAADRSSQVSKVDRRQGSTIRTSRLAADGQSSAQQSP